MLRRIWLHAVARLNERRARQALLRSARFFRLYVERAARSDKYVRRLRQLTGKRR